MADPVVAFEHRRRAPMRRHALGLALAAYVTWILAGVLALVGLAVSMGPSALVAALAGTGLIGAAVACWGADRLRRAPAPGRTAGFVEVSVRTGTTLSRTP